MKNGYFNCVEGFSCNLNTTGNKYYYLYGPFGHKNISNLAIWRQAPTPIKTSVKDYYDNSINADFDSILTHYNIKTFNDALNESNMPPLTKDDFGAICCIRSAANIKIHLYINRQATEGNDTIYSALYSAGLSFPIKNPWVVKKYGEIDTTKSFAFYSDNHNFIRISYIYDISRGTYNKEVDMATAPTMYQNFNTVEFRCSAWSCYTSAKEGTDN